MTTRKPQASPAERAGQFTILAVLAAVMCLSRPHALTGIVHMSDASNALFFIAGMLAVPFRGFLSLVALSALLDFVSIRFFGTSNFCVSPAYGFLWLAYAALWQGGRWLANLGAGFGASAAALGGFLALQCLAHLLSSGSFYFLSGRFADPDLGGLLSRSARYLPGYLLRDLWYVLFFLLLRQSFTATKQAEVGS